VTDGEYNGLVRELIRLTDNLDSAEIACRCGARHRLHCSGELWAVMVKLKSELEARGRVSEDEPGSWVSMIEIE